jgi:NAD(P)-dependent dehydrogenase (short-subunit alcohol dehydrogenase family)
MNLNRRHVVITGAASGIGRALALRCAGEGAGGIVVSDIDGPGAQAVAAEIEASHPGRSLAVPGDVGDRAQLEQLIEAAERRYGDIDLFCANAGIGGGTGLEETSEAEWDAAFAVNVRSHIAAARLLVPGWVARGEGYFLSTASAAGLLTVLGSAPYAVTKHAAVAFAEWLAITYADRGVRVSCLCPMAVHTPLLADGLSQRGEAGAGMRLVTQTGAVLDPDAVADTVIEGIAQERFLILPHPEVQTMFAHKAADHDGWIAVMRQARVMAGAA